MKISIQTEGKLREFKIPNGFLLNPVTVGILVSATRNHTKHQDMKACLTVLQRFQRMNCGYQDWLLVEAETADGEHITITI